MNAIAIDIGASYLRGAIISRKGKIQKYLKIETPQRGHSGKIVTDSVIVLINALLEDFPEEKIKGIGIASIGPINRKGEIIQAPNLPFKKVLVKEPLENYFSLPVIMHNDCAAGAWGEKVFGWGKKCKNFVYITLSSGIGGGAVINNRLLIGRGNASEIGHFNVNSRHNFPCSCKKGKSHWEAYCSGKNLPRFFKYWLRVNKIKRDLPAKTVESIIDGASKSKDKNLTDFMKEISRINGLGVSNVIAAYDPEMIIFGGGMVLNRKNQKLFLSNIKKNIDEYMDPVKVKVTRLGDQVTLYGAAALVFYPPE